MEITGSQTIDAPRQLVWDALNDPQVLQSSLPGCESVVKSSPDEFTAVMAVAIGPLRARFHGSLKMTEVSAPQHCKIVFEGQGGAIGFGKGTSLVELTETPEGTKVDYTAKAETGGKLAQVGSRLIDGVARKMADDFFRAFKAQIAKPASTTPSPAKGCASTPSPDTPTSEASQVLEQDSRRAAALPATPVGLTDPLKMRKETSGIVMVPGWWLLVATGVGSALTVAGALFLR